MWLLVAPALTIEYIVNRGRVGRTSSCAAFHEYSEGGSEGSTSLLLSAAMMLAIEQSRVFSIGLLPFNIVADARLQASYAASSLELSVLGFTAIAWPENQSLMVVANLPLCRPAENTQSLLSKQLRLTTLSQLQSTQRVSTSSPSCQRARSAESAVRMPTRFAITVAAR